MSFDWADEVGGVEVTSTVRVALQVVREISGKEELGWSRLWFWLRFRLVLWPEGLREGSSAACVGRKMMSGRLLAEQSWWFLL